LLGTPSYTIRPAGRSRYDRRFEDDTGVGGEHGRRFDRFGTGLRMRPHDSHLAADVLLQQLGGGQQIEVEILLDQAQGTGVRQAAQQRRLGRIWALTSRSARRLGPPARSIRRTSLISARFSL
jgi:hypothetical protein